MSVEREESHHVAKHSRLFGEYVLRHAVIGYILHGEGGVGVRREEVESVMFVVGGEKYRACFLL